MHSPNTYCRRHGVSRRFTAAIVLCDSLWADPDRDSANGIDVRVQLDFLRLDSMIMMVQLNIREILSVRVHGWLTWPLSLFCARMQLHLLPFRTVAQSYTDSL